MRSKKAIYNIITNLIQQLIVIVYGFIVPKIIIKSFGSDVNGLVTSITQFLAYIALLESGFGPVVKSILYKPIAKNNEDEIENILKTSEKFFRRISYVFLIYILILCVAFPTIIKSDFSAVYTISLIIIIALSTFAEYFFGMTYRLYLQAKQQTYIISIIQTITYLLNIIIVYILTMFNANIQMIKLVTGAVFILRPIMQNYYVKKKYNIRFNDKKGDYIISQKWDGLAQHIASVIHGNTDITVLTLFCNLAEVSVYSVYYLVVKGVKSLIQSFSSGIDSLFGDMIAKGEKENLNSKFELYEILYFSIVTIVFTSTMVLITPFIQIYTKGINDANYVRNAFGVLLVVSEYIWAIRLPYSSITLAAGHFKETKIGSWIECVTNIVISIILVWKYGIIGVAIGTIVAMLIRTLEFVYHTNKYILERNSYLSVKKFIIIIFETLTVYIISIYITNFERISYLNWIQNAIVVSVLSTITVGLINYVLFKDKIKPSLIKIIKKQEERRK